MSGKLEHRYGLFIKASPEQVWRALTDAEFTKHYFFGSAVSSNWRVGSPCTYTSADGALVKFDGMVLVADRPRRLVQTLNVRFDPALANREEMTLGWEIEQAGEACLVTVIHVAHEADAKVYGMLTSHCAHLLSGMKTLLETGAPLRIGELARAQT